MNLVTALAIVIGVLGAIATYIFVGNVTGLGLQIWACFIAWASFFHCGGGEAGLKATIPANVWGSLVATVALILIGQMSGGSVPMIAVIVGVTVFILILGAHVALLSAIPAAVYGYACTAAFGLLVAGADPMSAAVQTSPFLNISISMIIGAIFGYVSGKIAGAIAK
ncbi:hypothetical protein HDIA_2781 [Hartmannibacter diazotrophicus]|uniref:DUF1097 domain-containing protein n=1 Tax=Hartmannibacter diazotrophicus TaxID=1482074 RepID=A0A2C9D7M7_9HYPH|nr:DUF1097 domain-containing protein [Hartmannibacter diazotrophicus]SON56322.1 hypothetical protein HDIA_2781 [Hartmannibacter diazotrophicus]